MKNIHVLVKAITQVFYCLIARSWQYTSTLYMFSTVGSAPVLYMFRTVGSAPVLYMFSTVGSTPVLYMLRTVSSRAVIYVQYSEQNMLNTVSNSQILYI